MPELYPCNPLIVNAFLGGLRRASRSRAVGAWGFPRKHDFSQLNQRSARGQGFGLVFRARRGGLPVRGGGSGRCHLRGLNSTRLGPRAMASCARHPVGRGGSWSGCARLRRAAPLRRTQGPQARACLRQLSSPVRGAALRARRVRSARGPPAAAPLSIGSSWRLGLSWAPWYCRVHWACRRVLQACGGSACPRPGQADEGVVVAFDGDGGLCPFEFAFFLQLVPLLLRQHGE
ncbi:hypothetical protein EDC62_2532 [Tibeticola sediminis]|uniref:Uncharacterized protein n=1 Tax=Tibeticola sediminis TaxID=1917811 RepID=A0A3N4UCP2_9BURK|nr:hypothetical protein EDC62_2532 [Tibeticola sediminis]